jgi:aspartate racemase
MKADGVDSAALFGTRNVMTENFYRRRLVAHGVDLLPPDMNNVEALDRIIYRELMLGRATRDSQRALKTMITRKEQDGAQAIVLACTELEMIVDVGGLDRRRGLIARRPAGVARLFRLSRRRG